MAVSEREVLSGSDAECGGENANLNGREALVAEVRECRLQRSLHAHHHST